jgi:ankyrin repeat protein
MLLLQCGRINVDLCNSKGQTALSYTAQNQAASYVKTLMYHEANHDSQDNTGRTPLSWVLTPEDTLGDYKRVINQLELKGANINSYRRR